MKTVYVALLGFGVVGRGTYHVLVENQKRIEKTKNVRIVVKRILEINEKAIKSSGLKKSLFTSDYNDILNDDSISIVVEMMGGLEPASSFIKAALKKGKNVVSSNKKALAAHLPEFKALAKKHKAHLKFEASALGAIPVISALDGNLAANNIVEIEAIVNGTSNYILTRMAEGMSYGDALAKAQALGFAEADPTDDVSGMDSANKLCLLADLAMDYYQAPGEIKRKGISSLTPARIKAAAEKGCKIKLIAKAVSKKGKVSLSVAPALVAPNSSLYHVDDEFNGIVVKGDKCGEIFMSGRGAGSIPTGSAVAGDVISIASF